MAKAVGVDRWGVYGIVSHVSTHRTQEQFSTGSYSSRGWIPEEMNTQTETDTEATGEEKTATGKETPMLENPDKDRTLENWKTWSLHGTKAVLWANTHDIGRV